MILYNIHYFYFYYFFIYFYSLFINKLNHSNYYIINTLLKYKLKKLNNDMPLQDKIDKVASILPPNQDIFVTYAQFETVQ